MRAISSIAVLAFICIFLAACQTAAESQPSASRSALVGAAYLYYSGTPGVGPAPLLAENTLRILFLRESAEFIEKNRKWVAGSDWRQGFKDLLDKVIGWKRVTLEKGPAHIYRLSHEYRKHPAASENEFDSLSYDLLRLAAEMGHAQAKAELPHRRHPANEPKFRAEFLAKMFAKAKKNDVRAQIYMGQEYLISRHIQRDPVKAYYWLLRAKANGRDVSAYLPSVRKALSPADQELVWDWIDKGVVPDL